MLSFSDSPVSTCTFLWQCLLGASFPRGHLVSEALVAQVTQWPYSHGMTGDV